MSLKVCVLMPETYHWFMACVVSNCKHLTGIEWMHANTEGPQQGSHISLETFIIVISLLLYVLEVSSMLQSADVVVSEPILISSHLDNLSKVKWVHSIWAGRSRTNPPPQLNSSF